MAARTPHLLIVDDEPDTCENLSDIFSDLGYQVDVAYDGSAAIQLVDQNVYDLALLDLKMPGMSGLELYREIRRRSAGTVAIIVTAYASSATAGAVLDAGAWGIVPKPVNFAQLQSQVDEALERPLILIVDDDPDLCQSLWDLFREQRYRACIAHDEETARRLVGARTYQVALVDMKLADGDGTKVLEVLHLENPDARTLIITGFAAEMNDLVQKALAAGADGVCYKPFDVDQLLKTVEELSK